jgi:hypothetical protein
LVALGSPWRKLQNPLGLAGLFGRKLDRRSENKQQEVEHRQRQQRPQKPVQKSSPLDLLSTWLWLWEKLESSLLVMVAWDSQQEVEPV